MSSGTITKASLPLGPIYSLRRLVLYVGLWFGVYLGLRLFNHGEISSSGDIAGELVNSVVCLVPWMIMNVLCLFHPSSSPGFLDYLLSFGLSPVVHVLTARLYFREMQIRRFVLWALLLLSLILLGAWGFERPHLRDFD